MSSLLKMEQTLVEHTELLLKKIYGILKCNYGYLPTDLFNDEIRIFFLDYNRVCIEKHICVGISIKVPSSNSENDPEKNPRLPNVLNYIPKVIEAELLSTSDEFKTIDIIKDTKQEFRSVEELLKYVDVVSQAPFL
jgi:hypothetical protein